MKYQRGAEFLIRSNLDDPAYRVRIRDIDEKLEMYHLQKIGHKIWFWVCEPIFERYIQQVDARS